MQLALQDMISRASSGDYMQHGSIDDLDCVVAFSFGYRQVGGAIRPGPSNQQIADYLTERYFRLPRIVQFEIADAMPSTAHEVYRIERHRRPGAYLHTREVAEQAKKIMDRHGWKKAVVIAHPNHMPRADAVCRKLGMETLAPGGLGAIEFDPGSAQPWTQNPANWLEHETKAIDRDAEKGWI